MDSNICNAEMATGDRCDLAIDSCDSAEHRQRRRLSATRVRDVFANRDVRSVAWYWLEALSLKFDAKNASPAVSWARLIQALGDAPQDAAEAAAEAALLGGIMHGIPPRDAGQWEIVERMFDPQTVQDLRRWRPNPFTLGPDEHPDSMPQPGRAADEQWDEDLDDD